MPTTVKVAAGEIKGELGEITMLHTMGRIPAKRAVVAGLGKSGDWVHLDIAGTSTASGNKGHLVKGATGAPTRTLAQLAVDLASQMVG